MQQLTVIGQQESHIYIFNYYISTHPPSCSTITTPEPNQPGSQLSRAPQVVLMDKDSLLYLEKMSP